MNAPFDTLALKDALKDTPLGEAGAAVLARAIADVAMSEVATKSDVRDAVHSMTVRLGGMIAGAVAVLGLLITLHS